MGKVSTLRDGVYMARDSIRSGNANRKLREWVTWQNVRPEDGLRILDRMIAQAS
jgi:hypothetical protein